MKAFPETHRVHLIKYIKHYFYFKECLLQKMSIVKRTLFIATFVECADQ